MPKRKPKDALPWVEEVDITGPSPQQVRITGPRVAFPVPDYVNGGFGQLVVCLEPGQRETVDVNGTLVTVIREWLH